MLKEQRIKHVDGCLHNEDEIKQIKERMSKMNTTEEVEVRLNQHDEEIGEIKETVIETNEKVEIIVKTTDKIATSISNQNTEQSVRNDSKSGTIQRNDHRGTIAAIVSFVLTTVLTGWQLWSVMYADANPFLATMSVLMTPSIWVLIQTLSGKNIKDNDVLHQLEIKKKEAEHKVETDKLKGVNQIQMIEINNKSIKIARLEEKRKITDIPLPPIRLPPTSPK